MKLFNSVPISKPKRNKFDLSRENKFTCNIGDLIPIAFDEVMPGDKFRVNVEAFARLAPMTAPVMHRMNMHFYHFYTPYRLIHEDFETMMTGGKDGLETVVHPFIEINNQYGGVGTLADYLGINFSDYTPNQYLNVNAFPFRVYQEIYNNYFRDQNLHDEVEFSKTSGQVAAGEIPALTTLRKKTWSKDYFTSALPWPQKGAEVLIPLESEVNYKDTSTVHNAADGGPINTNAFLGTAADNAFGHLKFGKVNSTETGSAGRIENIESVTNGTANIESLRRANMLQVWLEKMARGGSRIIEQTKTIFGVTVPDYRVARPEFLGSSVQPIVISEVLANFESAEIPQGNMSGHGMSVGGGHGYTHFFPEHGCVMTICCIMPQRGYFQGLNRYWFKLDRYDYPWPDFAHIGEQEIYNREIYNNTTDGLNDGVFGYTPRYAEYKYRNNEVHGEFKTNLDHWHMNSKFASRPQLNTNFIDYDPSDERIWNVIAETTDHFYIQSYIKVDAIRPLPYFGVPRL